MTLRTSDRLTLTYDDVNIVPKYSEIAHRSSISLRTKFTRNTYIDIPIVAAPMDKVCDSVMAAKLFQMGGVGCIHRFMPIDEQSIAVQAVRPVISLSTSIPLPLSIPQFPICAAVGVTGDYMNRAIALVRSGATVLLIDVAHGHHLNVKLAIQKLRTLKDKFPFDIIAGSIATGQAARDLYNWGADAVRVGIGNGSLCETRIRTGIGVPQVSALDEVVSFLGGKIPVIADGGIRWPGDVAKALAVGADSVMLGSLLAGTTESPGQTMEIGMWGNTSTMKVFRGSASKSAKNDSGSDSKNVEGATHLIKAKGSVSKVIDEITDGLRSAFSYVGANNITEFKDKTEFVRVTQSGILEAKPHLLS